MTDRWPRGMRERDAAEYVGLSVSSLRASDAPRPVQLTAGRVVYLRDDLDAWLDRKAGRASDRSDTSDTSEADAWMAA